MEDTLTRGELARLVCEKAGQPSAGFDMDYADVSDDAAYTEAVRRAGSEGLVVGYGNGAFGPEDTVLRKYNSHYLAPFHRW